jgi:hypothetical protein
VTLQELLAERGIKRALVVDDACDEVPRAVDLAGGAAEWPNFAADLTGAHKKLLNKKSPDTAEMAFDAQVADDRYVAAVWRVRDQLDGLADPIFEAYIAQRAADLDYVEIALEGLEALGLEAKAIGRGFEDAAQDVDLILIDLYFGGQQNEEAFEESKRRLAEAVARRSDNPPLVLLMSRSERIFDRRDNFRDEVRLVDSGFRILLKRDLKEAGRLDRQIERLADNRPDTLKLARFFNALENGIEDAAERTLGIMRRLKLSDIAQLQQLLLDVEGEPPGSYLVDIFDRVLQHEIEREGAIIDAALDVNNIKPARHPPPYVAGSPQLQDVVERTLTQNVERLRLPGSTDSPLTFGDILQAAQPAQGGAEGAPPPFGLAPDDVAVVLSPVCDLQRGIAPQALFMVGKLQEIDRTQWSYGPDARTPAIRIDGELRWVKWNLKHIVTATWADIDAVLEQGAIRIVARLRESHALEIQQRLLAGLGRVGLVARMPATFAVTLAAYLLAAEGPPRHLEIAELADEAVVWVGRDDRGKQMLQLVPTERICDGLEDALQTVDEAEIAEAARPALAHLKASGELGRQLAGGFDISLIRAGTWLKVPSLTGAPQVPDMALLALNELVDVPRAMKPKAGILIVIREAERKVGAPSLEDLVPAPAAVDDTEPAAAEAAGEVGVAGGGDPAEPPAA